jgi:DNA-binding protein
MVARGRSPLRVACSAPSSVTECLSLFLKQRFLQEHGEVQLSALGVAISSMVTLAEILKNKQLAVETRVVTSLEEISSESR